MGYILSIDQGTTSSRTILFDHSGSPVKSAQQDFEQIFPKPGWVEHDPLEIWESQLQTMQTVISELDDINLIKGIGITNQRETALVWNRDTGEPIYNAIVWQDRRTATFCDGLTEAGKGDLIQAKTGLVIDAYFSGSKVSWILKNVEGARKLASDGKLCFGTVDSWLIYNLTKGELHITDVSNACRTMLFNIHDLCWDEELLELFKIPKSMLPKVVESSQVYGHTHPDLFGNKIPISGIAGDQQAALFGQMCVEEGMAKNTYGTGCFLLMNTGNTPIKSTNNLLTTIGWTLNGQTTYALEGSVFVGGAAVQWIRDGLNLVDDAKEIEDLANSVEDNGGVVFVPALTGLGAPYWDPYARGSILGLTRGTNRGHIARATLEGIAFQVYDLIKAMEEDSGKDCTELRVDGGASANNILMQFQSDLFQFEVIRSKIQETTALGAAYLAGLAVGYWSGIEEIRTQWAVDQTFKPELSKNDISSLIEYWHKAVDRTRNWINH